MIELEHSPLGGSGAHRFMNCEGSFVLHRREIEAGTFEIIESEFARKGTGAHELGATCLAEGHEPFEFLGEEFNGYLVGWPDGIELDAVHVYVNYCRKIMERDDGPAKSFVERTFHFPEIHPLLKGTVDFGKLAARRISCVDYKNGEGIGVHAIGSHQLRYYGFLLLLAMAKEGNRPPADMPMDLGIVQPNFFGIYEEPEIWETTAGDVWDWGHNILLPTMNRLYNRKTPAEDADFTLGEHCQFCPVLLDCPKMQEAYQAYVDQSEDFVIMLSNQELTALYANREPARRFMKALEETVFARKLAGQDIPSAKLVEKQTRRVWKPGAEVALKTSLGDNAFTKPVVMSPAQVEKLSSRGKELATEWAYKPDTDRLTVAPLSDRRPEAKPRTNEVVFAAHAAPAVNIEDF